MADNNQLGGLIFGFILLIVGIILLSVVADSIFDSTNLSPAVNEALAISSTSNIVTAENITITEGTGNTLNSDLINVTFFGNSSLNTSGSIINLTTEVNFTRLGVITTSGFGNRSYDINYLYRTDAVGQTANADVEGVSFFGNGTVNTSLVSITIGEEVNFTFPGVINVDRLNFSDGSYLISYTYQGAEYVADPISRVVINLIPIFMALAVMLIGVIMLRNFGFFEMFK